MKSSKLKAGIRGEDRAQLVWKRAGARLVVDD